MDAKLYSKITIILTINVVGFSAVLLLHTASLSAELVCLTAGYVAVVIIRDYVLKVDLHRLLGVLFIFLQLAMAFAIAVLSEDFLAQVFILILIGEFTFHHAKLYALFFTVFSYLASVLGLWAYRDYPTFEQIYLLLPRVIEYFAIFGISFLAKIAFQQKEQLARDNEQLRIASIELGRKAKMQERTRISRDIHDTVGHTLTSALTGLQTASRAIEKKQYDLAVEMIERTRDNILSGLDDVRTSVHLLRENHPGHQLLPELRELIETTRKQTNVDIQCDIDMTLPDLSPLIEIALYRALQEGLTNGIRHGASTFFQFTLKRQGNHVHFMLTDNGQAPLQLSYGFGLSAMKERVEVAGGVMRIGPNYRAGGVTLEIIIPIEAETTGWSESIV